MATHPQTLPEVSSRSAKAGVAAGLHPNRRHVWLAVSALLVIGGTVAAVFAARSVANNDAENSRQAFEQSSEGVASTLQLAIQHQRDFVLNASAYVLGNPQGTGVDAARWASTVHASEEYPELQGMAYAVVVPAAELPAFAARATVDPAGSLAPDGSFAVNPPGDRPFYCFLRFTMNLKEGTAEPAGNDLCSGLAGTVLLAARDSGRGAYFPFSPAAGTGTLLAIETPIYEGGAVPETVAARQATFAGWVGTAVDPNVILERALRGHPGMAVSMRYAVGSSRVAFSIGQTEGTNGTASTDLNNGWTVKTYGSVESASIFANRAALALLISGLAVSVLLAVLVLVLGTGRARALRLVGARTGELRHQALHDALTGLPNRALIMDRIDQLLVRNRRNGTAGAALFVDLDEFKNVNDTLGHAAGDQLLIAVAARLESALRDADTIGRMGGDEFVVLIDGGDMKASAELVAGRLLDVMRQPFELTGSRLPLFINTSVGIASGDRATGGDLLRDADVALYQAKAAGKNRYEVFHPEMQTEISERIGLEFDLRSALEQDEFSLVYQPIYNLDDLTLVGVEALIRWNHPLRGLVQPNDFIPILEQTGQIRAVGQWVLTEACAQMAAWHARGDTLDVSVNVSGRQLDSDDIIEHIREALAGSGLPGSSLIIEVTETALMRNAAATAKRLGAIKELGVRIAVDDFGTGYSSLAYLQQFPVDCLKIDRTFTNAIASSPESKALMRTLVQLGKDLGLKTLAEGVETSGQMDQLRGEHVNQAQGFLLARPLDGAALEEQVLAPMRKKGEAA